ncbi:hypothetical protein O3P69_015188 [Scylla paramamosain]|uniref:Uncharacterized protein n=1 Tax=Scylla paramamosain TaxID=85552 RepID=A0AAW0T472_SCYPA
MFAVTSEAAQRTFQRQRVRNVEIFGGRRSRVTRIGRSVWPVWEPGPVLLQSRGDLTPTRGGDSPVHTRKAAQHWLPLKFIADVTSYLCPV